MTARRSGWFGGEDSVITGSLVYDCGLLDRVAREVGLAGGFTRARVPENFGIHEPMPMGSLRQLIHPFAVLEGGQAAGSQTAR